MERNCGICLHYLAIKHGILSFAGRQMGLEVIMLNESNQNWQDKSHAFSHLWNLDLKAKIKPEGRRRICCGEEGHKVEGNKTGCA